MKQVLCGQLGLSCDYVIQGETEEEIMKQAVEHIWEHNAIKPEEITSEMKVKLWKISLRSKLICNVALLTG